MTTDVKKSQWHWHETNHNTWAEGKFNTLFSGITFDGDVFTALGYDKNSYITTLKVDKLTGQSFHNVRKARLIISYDYSISINFEGSVIPASSDNNVEAGTKVEGTLVISDFTCQDSDLDDVEFEVNLTGDNRATDEAKAARKVMLKQSKALKEKLRQWIESLTTHVNDWHAAELKKLETLSTATKS